nr:MAG TPA: hypothetical protein [Caudoviricetes sp.]
MKSLRSWLLRKTEQPHNYGSRIQLGWRLPF